MSIRNGNSLEGKEEQLIENRANEIYKESFTGAKADRNL